MTRIRWYLLVAGAFTLHNTEEALGAPVMLRQLQTQAPRFLRAFYAQTDVSDLRTGLVVLTCLGIALVLIAARSARATGWAYAMLVFGTFMGINALAHVGLSVLFRAYMPGLLTAILVSLPLSITLWYRASREAWVPRTWFWTVVPAAVVVHGPLLAGFLRAVVGQA